MPSSSGKTIYRNRLGQFWTLNIRFESFWPHCLVVSIKFLGHSGPWVRAAPSSGHLDPLIIPLSFFRESKAVLASTIIVFEKTSCLPFPSGLIPLYFECSLVSLAADWNDVTKHVQRAGLIRQARPPTFSDMTDHRPSSFHSSGLIGCMFPDTQKPLEFRHAGSSVWYNMCLGVGEVEFCQSMTYKYNTCVCRSKFDV